MQSALGGLRNTKEKRIMNAREVLACVADWLGWQEEDLSAGLKSAEDGLRLYMYGQTHPELPEMADEWEPKRRIQAVGYEPMGRWQSGQPEAKFLNRSALVSEPT
jgi:predicted transcriptional regulator